jgi:hypothetical protein
MELVLFSLDGGGQMREVLVDFAPESFVVLFDRHAGRDAAEREIGNKRFQRRRIEISGSIRR